MEGHSLSVMGPLPQPGKKLAPRIICRSYSVASIVQLSQLFLMHASHFIWTPLRDISVLIKEQGYSVLIKEQGYSVGELINPIFVIGRQ